VEGYQEYAASAEYLHLLSRPMWTGLRPRLEAALTGLAPDAGPVLELGAGSGLGTDVLLDTLPHDVLAAEPTGPDSVRWRMRYRTRRGDTVLAGTSADYGWWIVTAEGLAAELVDAGLDPSVDEDLVIGRKPPS
jgi:hypothetical protein